MKKLIVNNPKTEKEIDKEIYQLANEIIFDNSDENIKIENKKNINNKSKSTECDYEKITQKITGMSKEEINNIIEDIMIKDGPDGHTDGSYIISHFITYLISGSGKQWHEAYSSMERKREKSF
jgi:hypothetical protein